LPDGETDDLDGLVIVSLTTTEPRDNPLRVWIEPTAWGSKDFVIGADTSAGYEDGDFSCAEVIERSSGMQVAEWHGRIKPYEFAEVLFCLARLYSDALVGVEADGHGLAVLRELADNLGYRNIYYDTRQDELTSQRTKRIGWHTTARTKPLMIEALRQGVSEDDVILNSPEAIQEMLAFVFIQDKRGKVTMGAPEGAHDDRVMALAIAWQMIVNEHAVDPRWYTYDPRKSREALRK